MKQLDNTKIIQDAYQVYTRQIPSYAKPSIVLIKSMLAKDIVYKLEYDYVREKNLIHVVEYLRGDRSKHSMEQYEHGQLASIMMWYNGGAIKLMATYGSPHFIETQYYLNGKTKTLYTFNHETNNEMYLTFDEDGQLNNL